MHILFTEAFRAPVVNLRCEAGAALPGHLVNVTWQTDDNQLPDDVISRLQNCQASIDCTTGYRRYVCGNLYCTIILLQILLFSRVVVHTLPALV